MSSSPRSTRREFLQGKAAVDAIAPFDVGAPDRAALAPATIDAYLVRLSRRAMACAFEIFLNAGQYETGTPSALAALDLVDQLEDQLSVYREHSEISRLNRNAALGPVPVESQLFALLARAVDIHRETAGAYDVTAGRLSSVWGFTTRRGRLPAAEDIAAARACVGSQHLVLDAVGQSVHFRQPGLEINLGSIGKGYALDRCAQWLETLGIHDFLLHGGASSVLARGSHGMADDASGWLVGVRNPLHPERRVGQLRLADRALATSGSGTQFFMHEGRRYGHILDPRSGWPAEGVLTSSVLAPSAAVADALSTAFYVMGPQEAEEYCRNHADVSAVMLCPGPREGSLQLHLFGLDPSDWMIVDDV